MTDVSDFADLAAEFEARTRRIVWCTVATVAPNGAPWTRILHPIWEGPVGWIATTRQSVKRRHLEHEPRIGMTYWDSVQEVVSVRGRATWADDVATKTRIWDLYAQTPPPLGYDPGLFWQDGPSGPAFGLLRIDPAYIALTTLGSPASRLVWRA